MTCSVLNQAVDTVREKPIQPVAVGLQGSIIVRNALIVAEKLSSSIPAMTAGSGVAVGASGLYSIYSGSKSAHNAKDIEGRFIDGGLTVLAGAAYTGNGVTTVLTYAGVASLLGTTGAEAILSASAIYCGFVAFGISLINSLSGLIESYKFRRELNSILEGQGTKVDKTIDSLVWLRNQLSNDSISRFERQVGPKFAKHMFDNQESLNQLIRKIEFTKDSSQAFADLSESDYAAVAKLLSTVDRANHQKNTSRVILAIAAALGLVATALTMTGIGAAITVPVLLIIIAVLRLSADIATITGAISNLTFQSKWAEKIDARKPVPNAQTPLLNSPDSGKRKLEMEGGNAYWESEPMPDPTSDVDRWEEINLSWMDSIPQESPMIAQN